MASRKGYVLTAQTQAPTRTSKAFRHLDSELQKHARIHTSHNSAGMDVMNRNPLQKTFLHVWRGIGIAISLYIFFYGRKIFLHSRQTYLETTCADFGRIISRTVLVNVNHVKDGMTFIQTLNATYHQHPPLDQLSFGQDLPPCNLPGVPRIDVAAVENHLERTKLPHSIIERIMYTARIRHADRTRFEDCMGFTIKDWHTQEVRGAFPEYAVKVYGSNLTLLAERDFLSLSDIHSHMFPKVQRSTTLTLSEPFPLIISGEEDTQKMFRKLGYLMMLAVRDPALGDESLPEVLEQATVGYVRRPKGIMRKRRGGDGGTSLTEVQVMGTVDFEKTIKGLEAQMQQGSGRDSLERVLIRIDDVTLPLNPIPLYEPDQERTRQMKGFEPPQGLRYLGWANADPKYFVGQVQVSLQLGDPSRSHDLRCKYEGVAGLPLSAILLALGFLVIDCMVLQLVWGALNRFATLRADLLHEKTLKSSADAGTTTKNVFLSSMTKEIRTPINGLLGMLGLLLKTPLEPDQLDYVRTAEASGKALIWLINDMLDYAQVETGHLQLDAFSFNLRALVDEVLALLTPLAHAKEHPLEVAAIVHQGVPTQVIADPLRLRQVLIHVATNALKFTQRGHILISVRALPEESRYRLRLSDLWSDAPPSPISPTPPTTRRFSEILEAHQVLSGPRTLSGLPTADDSLTYDSICQVMKEEERRAAGDRLFSRHSAAEGLVAMRRRVQVEFTVEDTGIGIPPASREVMFQPFAIVNGTQQRTYGGTGIGLALSQRLTALMGGRIQYVSEVGVGSTFRFRCNLEALEGGPEGMGALPALGGLQGKSVLVVDGSHVRQQVVVSHLRHLGMVVDVSDNLYGALAAIQTSVVHSVAEAGARGEAQWDVVFVEMDAEGPGTGIHFGQLLLKSDEIKAAVWRGVSIPKLVLLSSRPPEEVEAESHRNFFAMCIGKPLRSIPLAHSLQRLLGVTPSRSPSSTRSMSTGSEKTDSRMLFSLAAILEHKRVLVCDHALVDRKVASETLDRLGAGEVHCVSSGHEALRLLVPPHNFDCVLIDIEMPGMDGYEVARRIRGMEEDTCGGVGEGRRVPILAHTALGSRAESLKSGMNAIVTKPIEEEAFVRSLMDAFGHSGSVSPRHRKGITHPIHGRRQRTRMHL